jgi:hypothetical protein
MQDKAVIEKHASGYLVRTAYLVVMETRIYSIIGRVLNQQEARPKIQTAQHFTKH